MQFSEQTIQILQKIPGDLKHTWQKKKQVCPINEISDEKRLHQKCKEMKFGLAKKALRFDSSFSPHSSLVFSQKVTSPACTVPANGTVPVIG
ncbi:hypothetical protein CEXT_17741 [Caerostris extrusa]|uniref:Uncharacterized protein n=1 Tax=Caerostris extrusa TaxID=172846 RepID=A0AAV4XVC5_CAEEX|nr:hypothetical protein CEXT_17741 [Caerostris extrusa]